MARVEVSVNDASIRAECTPRGVARQTVLLVSGLLTLFVFAADDGASGVVGLPVDDDSLHIRDARRHILRGIHFESDLRAHLQTSGAANAGMYAVPTRAGPPNYQPAGKSFGGK